MPTVLHICAEYITIMRIVHHADLNLPVGIAGVVLGDPARLNNPHISIELESRPSTKPDLSARACDLLARPFHKRIDFRHTANQLTTSRRPDR